ncbi:MAG TPA: hypothetical protein VGI39_34835 [Polyangiaceae bacterium]|jgi:hypothetical protein
MAYARIGLGIGFAAMLAVAAGCSSSDGGTGDATPDGGTGTPAPNGSDSGGGVVAPFDAGASPADATSPPPSADAGTDGQAPAPDAAPEAAAPDAGPSKESLVWVWQGYSDALNQVAANAASFTQVSPALYQLNFSYSSGPAQLVNSNDDFDGLSSQQVAQKIHDAGLKCVPLMYAGAGNFGTDQGIQNVLDDSPAGAQQSFITSMVSEAKSKGYDGYNLDWEVSNTGYAAYGQKLITFLGAFKDALHKEGMTVSLDLGGWYVRQCNAGGSDGLVDLTQLGTSVDWAIMEDYSGALGTPGNACPAANGGSFDCDSTFAGALNAMCNLPPSVVSIGLISTGTNPFAGDALNAVSTYGFTSVAVWPDDSTFMNGSNISPAGATWYSLLADFLAKK